VPKELLPIVDTPAMQYIVEEAVRSGLSDILVVTGRGKEAIADHFDQAEVFDKWELRYLQVATDGLLTTDKKLRGEYGVLDDAIRQAVSLIGHTPMVGRKSLGEVLDAAINAGGKRLPRPVFKVMKQLKEGGETNLRAVPESIKRGEVRVMPNDLTPEQIRIRVAAWDAFNERPDIQKMSIDQRGELFEKEYKV